MSTVRNIKRLTSCAVLALAVFSGTQAFAGGVVATGGQVPVQPVPNFAVIQQNQQIIQQDQQMRQNYQLRQQIYRDQDRPRVTPQQMDVPRMKPQNCQGSIPAGSCQ
ncbi:hypothetical protein [Pseudaminobacter salicylatoxidans]|uniref:hypothetical protein n=1 Tax=Pseudaminobacter salicylatoxidans TaxID=93369 RepID=UPI00035D59EA|nr:hypothetical protein [Pseudaminobacter salicylatoxidans]